MVDPRRFAPIGVAASALALTALAAAALLALGGYDPLAAGAALWRGAFGGVEPFVSVTLVRSVPLILTGLAVALAFRAGIWNIGAEGQLYAGAMAAVWVGLAGEGLPFVVLMPAVMAASLAAGALWALVPTLMRLRLGVGEVITTILMNFVAINLAAWLVHGPLQEARGVFPQTDAVAQAARLPILVPGTRLHMGLVLAVGVAVGMWAFFRWTRAGFAVRTVGASPDAARVAARLPARRIVFHTFLVSGAVAGLAGGVEITGVTYALYENLSPGWGYTAIAVALLAGLNPLAVLATGVFFGALQAGAGAMQRSAGIPSVWVGVVEALVILSALAVDQVRRRWVAGRGRPPERDGPDPGVPERRDGPDPVVPEEPARA